MLNDFFIEILVEMNHNFFEQNIELALELNVENTGMLFYLCRWIQNYVNPESNLLQNIFSVNGSDKKIALARCYFKLTEEL